ncbi:regulatory protein GemA [Pseudoruegeria sp. HB172150]|uniref:regulatory protein GemA n=1 Tax=Pseudoruegeria sp. HB172150 TaxID=2721164 RepID=UPI0015554CBF|nr:regulatory protein GemA [Pseudoruegeria sp. HB172150]
MTDRRLQKLIFAGCRELGIDNDTRRDLQLVTTGKDSLGDMTEAEQRAVVAALKEKGFRPGGHDGRRPKADRSDVRFAHVLWRLLADHGEVQMRGAAGLNAFIRRRFADAWGSTPIDIDRMQDAAQIRDVIEALKSWCRRSGIELETGK